MTPPDETFDYSFTKSVAQISQVHVPSPEYMTYFKVLPVVLVKEKSTLPILTVASSSLSA